MTRKIAVLLILSFVFGAVNLSADNIWEKVKKEAKEQVEKAVEKGKDKASSKNKSKSKKKNNKSKYPKTNEGYAQWENERAEQKQAQQKEPNPIPREHHPLFEPLGEKLWEQYGIQSPKLTMPNAKTPSAQAKWLNGQVSVDSYTNQRVFDEYIALQEYNNSVPDKDKTEGVIVRIHLLEQELNKRAKAINTFVKSINSTHKKQDKGVTDRMEYTSDRIAINRQIHSDGYKLALRSSLSGLRVHLSEEAKLYFEERGGLENVHLAPRTNWTE